MIFTDPFFLFAFLPVVCAGFYLVSAKFGSTGGLAVILAASVAFYAPWGIWMLSVLLASVVVNFMFAQAMLSLPESRLRLRKACFVSGELFNFGALIWFKYHFVQRLVFPASAADLIVPIGISFYTFHQAAFLADAFNREPRTVEYVGGLRTISDKLRGFVRYAAFVMFFPQLVIGPITYLREFQPQVTSRRFGQFRHSDAGIGLMLIALGMFKKVVIADNLALYVDPVFSQAANVGAGVGLDAALIWTAILAYYAQLYFDFSGYSDMALGVGRLFGIRFPINFFSPLKAVGIIDFYRRWHMTLTRVISRFLYTPLSLAGTRFAVEHDWSGVRRLLIGVWVPLLINFEVIALWHGATLTFVAFGLIHGVWYTMETQIRTTAAWKRWKRATSDRMRTFLGRALFIVPMSLTFALFRSADVGAAVTLVREALSFNVRDVRQFFLAESFPLLAFAFAVIYLMPNSVQLLGSWRPGLMTYENDAYQPRWLAVNWRPNWSWSAFMLGLFAVSLYFAYRQPPFLYMGF